ncbi:PRC-barrel domain containing protein [Pedobacter sp.]|uniref:PRC-barrel domain containing protein n=1 Tax=Pedobacter sp. TaxID=1411316 RepID=UPI003C380BAF
MKRSLKSFSLFSLGATDGEIGKVKELYLDDESWQIRYWVVDTGDWLPKRKVLISVQSLLVPDWENGVFETSLSLDQIKNSPDIDTDKPVSRQQEVELNEHFSWQNYWFLPLTDAVRAALPSDAESNGEPGNPHLRSSDALTGYQIQASDGPIGQLVDFIIETDGWSITDFVVDMGTWLSSKKVLLPVRTVIEINWSSKDVSLALQVQEVKQAHPYDPGSAINNLGDGNFLDFYGRLIS